MYSCQIYNVNVASSITAQGKAMVSSMTLHFEMMLNNNVKFGSLDEVVEFINNIKNEAPNRKFNDYDIIDHWITPEECFAKLILSCGYRWIPDSNEMDIIWKIINNLSPHDLNRIYYKNNLFAFCDNPKVFNIIRKILHDLDDPILTSAAVPEYVMNDAIYFRDLIFEYVYYRYMFIDRIDRCNNMIKSVTMVSDTDSTIISLDGWYRYVVNKINGESFKIANPIQHPLMEEEHQPFKEKKLDYNFDTDEIIETEYSSDPTIIPADANIKYSIINLLSFCLDKTVNDYMIKACENANSINSNYHTDCAIFAKNEFLFSRLFMTTNKKNYAAMIEVQEGNLIPEDEQFDVKGIQLLTKSVTPESTKKALKKILIEDVLKAPKIDQVKFIKDIAIMEKQIIDSVRKGSKEFYKPATVKSIGAYSDPMRIQGIKASIAWNMIKRPDDQAINIDERNAIDIAKVNINRSTVDKIKDSFPDVYENILKALDDETFKTYAAHPDPKTGEKKLLKNEITAVAIPLDTLLPEWLEPFIDYDSILADNINSFPFESLGLKRMGKNSVGYTNIISL